MSNFIHPQTTLGKYKIIATLGQGGMGRVHLVQDPVERLYAAKELLLSPEGWSEEKLKRFELECSILARLDSPHIVKPVGGIQKHQHIYFYLMEYVPGKNLQQLLKTYGRFSPQIATHYMLQLLNALETAHQQQIIHRDIKPSNLIINPDGVLKVTDFGIAFDTNATHFTQTGCFLGTPYTISPEQARGEESVPASDIYSLGIVFYELLVGIPPFQAKNALALLYQHQEKTPPSLKEVLPEIPQKLEQFLTRCLKKLPQERFCKTQDAKQHLEEIFYEFSCVPTDILQTTQSLGKQSALVFDTSKKTKTSTFSQRSWSKKWEVALFFFFFLGIFFYFFWEKFYPFSPQVNPSEVSEEIHLLLKDQSILEGKWGGIREKKLFYQKKTDVSMASVLVDTVFEVREQKPIFSIVELFFYPKDNLKSKSFLLKLLGIDAGILYGIDSQNRFQSFPLTEIREYRYLNFSENETLFLEKSKESGEKLKDGVEISEKKE